MPEIKEIRDRASEIAPSVKEKRDSQEQGGKPGEGLPENSTGPLNSCQGHAADIKE